MGFEYTTLVVIGKKWLQPDFGLKYKLSGNLRHKKKGCFNFKSRQKYMYIVYDIFFS